jgi:hypothetical protein
MNSLAVTTAPSPENWSALMEEYLDILVRQVMASIETDVEIVGSGWDPRAQVAAWLEVKGRPERRLYVAMPYASGVRLSALVTGLTAEQIQSDPSLVQDLVGEITNIMAGHLWPALEGATGIGLPKEGLPPGAGGVVRRYMVGGDSLMLAGLDTTGA